MDSSIFDVPRQFVLCNAPRLHLLRSESIYLRSADLHGEEVHYVVADWRCDQITINLRRQAGNHQEALEVFCGFCFPKVNGGMIPGWFSWASMNSWVFKRLFRRRGLTIVILSEYQLGLRDSERKFGTYVDFLRPDVVVVCQSSSATPLHGRLMDLYNDVAKMEVKDNGQNVVCVYFNNTKVNVVGDNGSDCSVMGVTRLGW